MGEVAAEFFNNLTFYQLLAILTSVTVGYVMFLAVGGWFTKQSDAKDAVRSKLWEDVTDELALVEASCLSNVEKIFERHELKLKCGVECGIDVKKYQFNMYSLVLERVLYHDVFNKTKTAIKQNGFHHLNKEKLAIYTKHKAEKILVYARKRIDGRSMFFPILKGTDEERFNIEGTIDFYTKVVELSINSRIEEERLYKEILSQYLPTGVIAKIRRLLNGVKNS